MFAYCGNNPVMGYDPAGTWDWEWVGKIAVTALVVGVSLTGVGAIAAVVATAASASVSAAVTTAVVTASISTTISAVDGAICAQKSGGDWRNGAMAGAMGGAVGSVISKLTGPSPLDDTTLRLNVAGRFMSSAVYDVTYDLFERGKVDSATATLTGVDTVMDATMSTIYYYYAGGVSNSYFQTGLNAILDGIYDIFQTRAYFTPQ